MAVTATQQDAFNAATLGLPMQSFSDSILLILFAVLYVWVAWVIVSQWRSWAGRKIDFYAFLLRSTRAVLVTLFLNLLVR